MFRSYNNEFTNNLIDKLDISEIIDIFTIEDMENMPPESRMWFRMTSTSGVFSSIYNKLNTCNCASLFTCNCTSLYHCMK